MSELITAFGLMLVIEGLLYAMCPGFMRKAMAQMLILPDHQMRTTALVTACLGVGVVWLVRG
ncbi:MAG: DUF2065 domain-containing protein [Magnetovibrio sp.]|nr:DUF2065 domain-containing protein [Magnetovibrio sp.]